MYILASIISTGIFNKFFIFIICFGIMTVMYMGIKEKYIIIYYPEFIILLLFEICYALMLKINNIEMSLGIILSPVIMYYCGAAICKLKNGNTSYITKCIIAISLGFFIHAMLNFATNIGSTTRNTIDIWTKNILAATLQGTMLTMMLSMFFYIYGAQKKVKLKIIYGIFFALSVMYLLVLGSRTQFLIAIIVFIFEMIFYSSVNKNKEKIKNFLKITIIFLIVIISYNINMFGIKEIVHESNLYERFNKSETHESDESRLENQVLAIKSMFNNPLGNKGKIGNLNYAHNMWLDVGKEVGIIPAILLISYTICTLKSVGYIIKSKNREITLEYKILISSIFIGININFLVEPIMQGIPLLFIMFAFINGMIDMQYYSLKKGSRNDKKINNSYS